MIFNKQKFLHRPETEGTVGDCWRTVIACHFNIPPEEVPRFTEDSYKDPDATVALGKIREWLAFRGYGYLEIPFQGECSLEHMLSCTEKWGDGAPLFLSGTSKNGVNHIVIIQDGEIIWDPAIDDSGIVGPAGDGYWWISAIVKL